MVSSDHLCSMYIPTRAKKRTVKVGGGAHTFVTIKAIAHYQLVGSGGILLKKLLKF